MAKSKYDIKTIEDGILTTSINKGEMPEKYRTKQKRDRVMDKMSNQSKKAKVDAAMELYNEQNQNQDETIYIEADTIEGEVEPIGSEPSVSVEIEKIKEETSSLTEKMSKYKKHQLPTDSKIFNGLKLNTQQKQFVINYCDPSSDTYNDKYASYLRSGYSAKNKNSLVANISMNLKKPKIREAMDRYRKSMIDSKKLEVSTEMVDILRHRATYDLSYFENDDGTPKPYSEIPEEWRCCVDGSDKKYFKGTDGDYEIKKWILCDRHKSMQELMKVMEVHQSLSSIPKNVGGRPPTSQSLTAAVDMGKDKDGNQGPKVMISIGNMEDFYAEEDS